MSSHHMDPEAFRRHGHALIDWLADFQARVADLPVTPDVQPGEIAARLPEHAPEDGEPFEALMADLDAVVVPGTTHWQSPGWFAYFPSNVSGPSILGELAAAGIGAQGMLWATSPVATEVELRVLDWLVDLLGLPQHFKHGTGPGGGTIQTTASEATHIVHVVARGDAPRPVAYTSAQAHSSVARGARVAGYEAVRLIPTDERHALRPDALRAAIEADRADGLTPRVATSAIGTTGTGAVDPVDAVADVAAEHGLWHHVDAAWAGSAMVLPEQRVHQRGVERADSYVFNPHKWLFTNFDCSVLYWKDRAPVLDTLSDTPPYLRDAATDMDLRDWQLPLGRRFRALKLWWVLRHYGARGLRHHVSEHIRLAQDLAARVDAHPSFEHVAPPSFSLVCFRHVDGNEATDALASAVNATGHSYLTASALGDTRFIRVAVGQANTTQAHVDRLWDSISQRIGSPDAT